MESFTEISKETKTDQNQNFPLFSNICTGGHEQVVVCSRPDVGLKAIITVHNTTLGPALGGTRIWMYQNEQ